MRLLIIAASPHSQAWPDHHEYVRWGIHAAANGPLAMYRSPPPEADILFPDGTRRHVSHREQYVCNYPPGAVYLFWLQGLLHGELDPERVSNTRAARFTYSVVSVWTDFILAAGCMAIVTHWRGRTLGRVAFALAFLLPPMIADSGYWGQTDSWVIAPAVWMVYFMIRKRWLVAGLCWGIALACKTQGILLAPIWVFAWLLEMRTSRHVGVRHRLGGGVISGAALALVVLNALALPFWVTSGSAWFRNCVLRNLRDEAPKTTLKSFNVWYVDLLRSEDPDTERTLLNVRKDTLGKGLAVIGLLAAGALAWRGSPGDGHRILVFAGAWLLMVVMLPTRVHERYILMCLPFMLCLACLHARYRLGVGALVFVALAQVTAFEWMSMGAGTWPEYKGGAMAHHAQVLREVPPEYADQVPSFDEAMRLAELEYDKLRARDRVYEWVLTAISLMGFGMVIWAAAFDGSPGRGDR